ncbi:hypothetical protein [Mycolicibacterium sp. XJ1904]
MKAPENRRGMKRANADSIVAGDWLYRIIKSADSSAPPGEYMMIVASVDTVDHAGSEVYRYSGDVYAVKGEGAWPQSAFLGAIELHQMGTGTWMSPLDGNMVVGCPLDEGGDPAEWGFDTTL